MGRRGIIGIMTWGVATVIAVSLAWVAVSHAVAGISDPIPKIMGHGRGNAPGELVPALDTTSTVDVLPGVSSASANGATTEPAGATTAGSTGGQSFPGAVDATGTQQPGVPASAGTAVAGGHGAGSAGAPQQGTPGSPGAGPVGGPSAGGGTGAQPPPPTVAPAPAPPATTAPSTVKSFGSPGGTITVRCTGDSIGLVAATPQSGYTTDVGDTGPDNIDVNFASSSHEYDMQVVCQGGVPAGSVDG